MLCHMYCTDCKKRPDDSSGVQFSDANSVSLPDMVYVLPEPVWPYAKIVAEYPSNAESIKSLTLHVEKTSDYLVLGSITALNVNCLLCPPGISHTRLFSLLSSNVTTFLSFLYVSCAIMGLVRTATRTLSPAKASLV